MNQTNIFLGKYHISCFFYLQNFLYYTIDRTITEGWFIKQIQVCNEIQETTSVEGRRKQSQR
jgi:hypothetical protein